jgi:hypothetical protein
MKEMPEMQEFLDNMETEVCNHYIILNKSETGSHTTDPTFQKLESTVVIKTSSFNDITLKNILLNTGCTKTLIKVNFLPAKYFEMHQKPKEILWTTNSGNFVTKYDIPLTFYLIDFTPSREIECVIAVDKTDSQSCYNMIIRRDLQQAMGMDILFLSQRLRWDGIEVPMQTANSNLIDLDKINSTNKNTIDVFAIASSTMKILDAKYEKADLDAYFKLVNHLDSKKKISLKLLLSKYEHLFDGLLGYWKTDPVDLRLKSGEMPFQLSPFPLPKIYEETLKK